jgi:hypothetical protein
MSEYLGWVFNFAVLKRFRQAYLTSFQGLSGKLDAGEMQQLIDEAKMSQWYLPVLIHDILSRGFLMNIRIGTWHQCSNHRALINTTHLHLVVHHCGNHEQGTRHNEAYQSSTRPKTCQQTAPPRPNHAF